MAFSCDSVVSGVCNLKAMQPAKPLFGSEKTSNAVSETIWLAVVHPIRFRRVLVQTEKRADERNLLVEVIANVAQVLKPRIVVVENVTAFLTRKVRHPDTNQPVSAANLLISRLSSKYDVFPLLTDLCDYGIPQTRRRAFLTFVKKGELGVQKFIDSNRVPYPRPTHPIEYGGEGWITATKALTEMGLPSLDAKSKETAKSDIPMHLVPVWDRRRYAMVAAIPKNSGRAAWNNEDCLKCGKVEVSINDVLCPNCQEPLLRPIVQDVDGSYRFITGFRSSSYKRMSHDKPATTVTTASGHIGSNNTIHPFENRLLSALECAYLQTFPADFEWGEALRKWGHCNIREMIGEAVPPLFTKLHGTILVGLLTGRWFSAPMSALDKRFVLACKKLAHADKQTGTVNETEF